MLHATFTPRMTFVMVVIVVVVGKLINIQSGRRGRVSGGGSVVR